MKPSIRALFFDAGNTLLRINYAAIAEQLALRGIRKSHEAVAQAEYRARVRLDPHLAPGSSTESRSVAGYYFRYVLEELGITDDTVTGVYSSRSASVIGDARSTPRVVLRATSACSARLRAMASIWTTLARSASSRRR